MNPAPGMGLRHVQYDKPINVGQLLLKVLRLLVAQELISSAKVSARPKSSTLNPITASLSYHAFRPPASTRHRLRRAAAPPPVRVLQPGLCLRGCAFSPIPNPESKPPRPACAVSSVS